MKGHVYRTYDDKGKPEGFDWQLLLVQFFKTTGSVVLILLTVGAVYSGCFRVKEPCYDEVIFISTKKPETQKCSSAGATIKNGVEDRDGAFFRCVCAR